MKRVKKYYNKVSNKLTNIALEKFVKSDYLRDTANVLPLTLLTVITRGVFNFLVTSRLKTDYLLIDFIFSLSVTVFFSLYSPFLYDIYNYTLNNEINNFSTVSLFSIWDEGWIFVELWKGRIFGTLGILSIFILFFVEVNSSMIQEFIFHTMLSSVIVDYLTRLSESKQKKEDSYEKVYDSEYKVKENIFDYTIIDEYGEKVEKLPPCFGNMENFEVSSSFESFEKID